MKDRIVPKNNVNTIAISACSLDLSTLCVCAFKALLNLFQTTLDLCTLPVVSISSLHSQTPCALWVDLKIDAVLTWSNSQVKLVKFKVKLKLNETKIQFLNHVSAQ